MSDTPFQPEITIDRSSELPLYAQIAEALGTLILEGELAPGTRIEDEVSMAKRLQVSRPTARQAMQSLADRGLVSRRRGAGTVVASPHVRRPMELSSLLSDLTAAGHRVETTLLEYTTAPATEEQAEQLEVAPGTEVTHLRRLRSADGEPIALMDNLLPAAIAPTREELEHAGLYDLLRARGIVPATAKQVIGARNATAKEADALDERRRAALLTAKRTTYDATGRVIEYGNHIYRASRYSFETSLFTG
ncbi:GntR family transcriptional regulator [Actinomyces sp. 432]|uniref:GntR family transcriptional regulator n=1 Tax=Actinomyces sp. 432 TaxID=2057798 RepID=UPI001373C52A|nr:GntR family transcriptional regulator [Actinomyces sp. 432]QHO91581.1 GntR family transcriptional regulator [Actinomyces sp. 432]